MRPVFEDTKNAEVLCHAKEAPHLEARFVGKDEEGHQVDRDVTHEIEEEVLPEVIRSDIVASVIDFAVRDADSKIAVAQKHVNVV